MHALRDPDSMAEFQKFVQRSEEVARFVAAG
jgi:hypothetical protein